MINVGEVYESKSYGPFVVIAYNGAQDVLVKFIETGYTTSAESGSIRKGDVKDRLKPTVCGVGYIGDGGYKASIKGLQTNSYQIWLGMMKRCYSDKFQIRHPTYIGCTVCEDWHNFQNFAEWFDLNYIDGFELDKDIRIDGNKIYSPETCLFVSHSDNIIKAKAKTYNFLNPNGRLVKIYNLSDFCRCNNLRQSHMSSVSSGNRHHHKGWTKFA